eukprot:scaffold15805_cov96-Skeletonema_dohrnii-CCMP3373.AAC.1
MATPTPHAHAPPMDLPDASVHIYLSTYISREGVKVAGEVLAQTTVAGRNNDKQVSSTGRPRPGMKGLNDMLMLKSCMLYWSVTHLIISFLDDSSLLTLHYVSPFPLLLKSIHKHKHKLKLLKLSSSRAAFTAAAASRLRLPCQPVPLLFRTIPLSWDIE